MNDYLSKASVRVVVVGLVAMAAVAVGAAAIGSVTATGPAAADTPDREYDEGPVDGVARPQGPDEHGDPPIHGDDFPEEPDERYDTTTCIQPLASWYGGILYFGAFAAVVVFIKRRYSMGASMFGLYALAPPALLSYFLATDCPDWSSPGLWPGGVGGSGEPPVDPLMPVVDVPPAAVLGVFGVVLVGTAAVMLRASGGETVDVAEPSTTGEDADPVDPRDIAAAAGRAADRLETRNADVDNEVYRAWWELTGLLDVTDPETATPGEFADAAVAVGMREADVAELTRLFEEVRYGERDAERREERALAVFRRIESTYDEG